MKTALKSFIVTLIVLLTLSCIVIVDANSSYTGFGEESFIMPSCNEQTGEVSGRMMGYDWSFEILSKSEAENALQALKRITFPFL